LYLVLAFVVPRAGSESAQSGDWRTAINVKEAAGVGLLVLSALLGLRAAGIWWSDAIVAPVVLVSGGVAVIWRQSSSRAVPSPHVPSPVTEPLAHTSPYSRPINTPLGELPRVGPRLIGGAMLVGAGLVTLLQSTAAVGTLRDLAIATVVVLAGVTLIFGTSWLGLVQSLRTERAERIRSQERAEMGAHLHDSVLQTLALIQRSAGDEGQVVGLARRQERELRDWLAGRSADGTGTLVGALNQMAVAVEADHRVQVEVISVGDAPLDDRVTALVSAAREAAVNAARHAGTGRVDVYAEVDGSRIEVYVRDRGPGFDLAAVPEGRRGVSESIIGRMERHGGQATFRTAPGEGTEVELVLG
jgi:hypothetical protein